MAELTKKIEIGLITIMQDQQLQVREDIVVYEGLVELSRTYTRYIASPGDDISEKPLEVQRLAEFLWTPLVIATYQEAEKKRREQFTGIPTASTATIPDNR
jgi:hypothetical protein